MNEFTKNTVYMSQHSRTVRLWPIILAVFIVIPLTACSKQSDTPNQAAKPPEPKNQTYRMIGGGGVISLVSSDELEIREDGQNIICKYTKQDEKLRVVFSARGTTIAKYFNMTPQGLIDETGNIYYEPATYEKIIAQIELNRQLWLAVEQDDSTAIEGLILKGAAVETRDDRRTALVMAIEEGKTNAVSALLKNRADPNQKVGNKGETVLFLAIEKGCITSVELLLKHGSRASNRRNDGVTPLMYAAAERIANHWGWERKPTHDQITSLLCDSKVDLNAQDNDGCTALGWSLRNGNLQATKILVAAGANRTTGQETGYDAFTLSRNNKNMLDAIRTSDERQALAMQLAQYPRLLIGTWRDKDIVMTLNSDGTRSQYSSRGFHDGTWSVKEDVISWGNNNRSTIVELTDSSLVYRDVSIFSGKRVPQEKVDRTRKMLVGTWRDEEDTEVIITINDDGTMSGTGGFRNGTWHLHDDVFTSSGRRSYQIVSSDLSTLVFKLLDGFWEGKTMRLTRVR